MSEKKSKSKGRGNGPSELTVRILCANAAGRCEFAGCNEYVFHDAITLNKYNKSNVAHIVASSSTGPRGDSKRSYELSDKIENLMLMCQAHHKLIDDYPDDYPENVLLDMKKKHEDRIRELCTFMQAEPSERVIFFSPIKNCTITHIDDQQTAKALLPSKKSASEHGIIISLQSIHEYNSQEYWADLDKQLIKHFQRKIINEFDYDPNTIFSVFPLAPIPLIIKLGYLFMDKTGVDIYQKKRQPDTWEWLYQDQTNTFIKERLEIHEGKKMALVLSLTAEIDVGRITSVFDADIIYVIKAEKQGVDSIKSLNDLSAFWHLYQDVLDEVKNKDKVSEICLFPAIPVSAAFEVGRRYMPGIYPKLHIFDDDNGFSEALTIGEEKI